MQVTAHCVLDLLSPNSEFADSGNHKDEGRHTQDTTCKQTHKCYVTRGALPLPSSTGSVNRHLKVPSSLITDQNIWCDVSARASRHGRKAKDGREARRALARHVGLILNQNNTCTFLQLGVIFGVHPHVPFHNFAIIRACACITVHWNANVYNETHVAIA